MSLRPHDRTDLFLAPVALAVDERIRELASLDLHDLNLRVALAANVDTRFAPERDRGLLTTIVHLIDMHDWQVEWDDRGVRLFHGDHSIVLGSPVNFTAFLEAEPATLA